MFSFQEETFKTTYVIFSKHFEDFRPVKQCDVNFSDNSNRKLPTQTNRAYFLSEQRRLAKIVTKIRIRYQNISAMSY